MLLLQQSQQQQYKHRPQPQQKNARFIKDMLGQTRFKDKNYVIIFDNASIHRTDIVKEVFRTYTQHNYTFTPPHSPHLNPIEALFLKWKWIIKQGEKNNHEQLLAIIDDAAKKITTKDCEGYYREVMRCNVHCAAGEPLKDYRPIIE
jgi:hypothetical protein